MNKFTTENNMNMQSKKNPPRGLFDEFDQLEKYRIDFEVFRDELNKIYQKSERRSNAGAKPYDYLPAAGGYDDVQDTDT